MSQNKNVKTVFISLLKTEEHMSFVHRPYFNYHKKT